MRSLWVKFLCSTCVGLLAFASPAMAGWNNVFQVTGVTNVHEPAKETFTLTSLKGKQGPVQAILAKGGNGVKGTLTCGHSCYSPCQTQCCDPCQQQCCTTRYVQRCYYQPVTCYRTQTYYQAVTTYRTSRYCEPVTTYRYTCQYDPCTCCYRRVAVPCTSYRTRTKCCPVQSWVQRCCQVPVTSYRRCTYWQPVTSCSNPCCPTDCCNNDCCNNGHSTPSVAPPSTSQSPSTPAITESQVPGTTLPEQQIPQQPLDQQPYGNFNGPQDGSGTKYSPPRQSQQPQPQLNRIVSRSNKWIQGRVVRGNNVPRTNVSLLFVNMDGKATHRTASLNRSGQFNVSLTSGRWAVYMRGSNGRREYHSRITVSSTRRMPFLTLVSR